MEYQKNICINKDYAKKITKYLNAKPNEYPEICDHKGTPLYDKETVFKTKDGKTIQMAIMVIPPADEESTAWAQAVLYAENGAELKFTDPEYEITGNWEIEYKNDVFIVSVIPK